MSERSRVVSFVTSDPEPVEGVRSHPLEFVTKPWGSFSTLEEGPGYKIKRLVVQPGQRLSLQKHRHRAEHWVVVAGTATVVRGDRRLTLRQRECIVIPRQAWHRIENHGRKPVVIIEVQHGSYLGEDDIVRKQDDYGRIAPGPIAARTGRMQRVPKRQAQGIRTRGAERPGGGAK